MRASISSKPDASASSTPPPQAARLHSPYWNPGNFVGGPDVFGPSTHLWSGAAASNSSVVHLPGKALRALVTQIPNLAIGLIEGLSFKGKCHSALAQMLGTRSVTERLAHLLLHLADAYGVRSEDGIVIGSCSPMPTSRTWSGRPASG
jgi:CRP/FNR family cyclic AMP-dependent transcriptional regulator